MCPSNDQLVFNHCFLQCNHSIHSSYLVSFSLAQWLTIQTAHHLSLCWLLCWFGMTFKQRLASTDERMMCCTKCLLSCLNYTQVTSFPRLSQKLTEDVTHLVSHATKGQQVCSRADNRIYKNCELILSTLSVSWFGLAVSRQLWFDSLLWLSFLFRSCDWSDRMCDLVCCLWGSCTAVLQSFFFSADDPLFIHWFIVIG